MSDNARDMKKPSADFPPLRCPRALVLWFLLAALLAAPGIFGKGRQEPAPDPLNGTWTLCITDFDVSALPPYRAVLGQLAGRYTMENLRSAGTRLWLSEEAAYYERTARLKTESAAAKKLAEKQAERDRLIFAGDTQRVYRQKLKKVNADIKTLRFELEKAKAAPMPIALTPAVKLTDGNLTQIFPPPPASGLEYYFCAAQKADALLTGRLTEYLNRVYLEISLWSVYAKGVTYTDSVLFSAENIQEGVTELSDRLFDHISGMLPAWIRVRTEPPNAVVIIGDHVAPGGETLDFTPGTVSITAFAEDRETFETKVELNEGERADVSITLTPLPVSQFDVSVKGGSEAALYDGAMYAGKTPMELTAPSGRSKNLGVETPDGKIAQTVFRVSDTPIIFDPKMPPPEDRTNTARRKFYSAYGRFWITLPLAVLGIGLNNTIASVYNASGDPKLLREQQAVYWTSMGLNIVMGLFLAESFYRIGRYVWEANKEAGPLVKKTEPPVEAGTESAAIPPPAATAGTTAVTPAETGTPAETPLPAPPGPE
jgi:hypothetical protein